MALLRALFFVGALGGIRTGSTGAAKICTLLASSCPLHLATKAKQSSGGAIELLPLTPAAASASAAHIDASAAAAPAVPLLVDPPAYSWLPAGVGAPKLPSLSFFKRKSRTHDMVSGGKKPVVLVPTVPKISVCVRFGVKLR